MTEQPGELGAAIERVRQYIAEYEDAPSWGGPMMYPARPAISDLRLILSATPPRNDGAGDVDIIANAAGLLGLYADYIRTVHSSELERHPYLPLVEDAAAALSALSQKGGE